MSENCDRGHFNVSSSTGIRRPIARVDNNFASTTNGKFVTAQFIAQSKIRSCHYREIKNKLLTE